MCIRDSIQPLEILPDPNTGSTQAEYEAGYELAKEVHAKLAELHTGVNKLRLVRKQIDAWAERLGNDDVTKAGEDLKAKLREVEEGRLQWGGEGRASAESGREGGHEGELRACGAITADYRMG